MAMRAAGQERDPRRMPRFFESLSIPDPTDHSLTDSAHKMAERGTSGEKHPSIRRRKIYTSLRLNGSCRVGNGKTCRRRRPSTEDSHVAVFRQSCKVKGSRNPEIQNMEP